MAKPKVLIVSNQFIDYMFVPWCCYHINVYIHSLQQLHATVILINVLNQANLLDDPFPALFIYGTIFNEWVDVREWGVNDLCYSTLGSKPSFFSLCGIISNVLIKILFLAFFLFTIFPISEYGLDASHMLMNNIHFFFCYL